MRSYRVPTNTTKRCDDCDKLIMPEGKFYYIPKNIKQAFNSCIDDITKNKVICNKCCVKLTKKEK